MNFPCPRICVVALLSIAVAALAIGCDRGIEPFDPNEEPVAPDLARIYPNGSARKAGPMGGGMPAAPAAVPRGAPAPAPTSDAGSRGTISGVIELDPQFYADRPANGLLFIIARTQPAGPPLAVLRVPTPSFPHRFEIGQAEVMIPGLVFEGEIKLNARLDSDGNAMTKLPGDLIGAVETHVTPGTTNVTLRLDQKL